MDLVNNYGSSDEEDNAPVTNTTSGNSRINTAPDTGFDVNTLHNIFHLQYLTQF